uniref:hypothetical protein n=1 Tax=Streptococcus pluranimalium TaxID=82348 RepID=UPI003F68C3ED
MTLTDEIKVFLNQYLMFCAKNYGDDHEDNLSDDDYKALFDKNSNGELVLPIYFTEYEEETGFFTFESFYNIDKHVFVAILWGGNNNLKQVTTSELSLKALSDNFKQLSAEEFTDFADLDVSDCLDIDAAYSTGEFDAESIKERYPNTVLTFEKSIVIS